MAARIRLALSFIIEILLIIVELWELWNRLAPDDC
jgi:hypothetical protein